MKETDIQTSKLDRERDRQTYREIDRHREIERESWKGINRICLKISDQDVSLKIHLISLFVTTFYAYIVYFNLDEKA